MAGVGTPFRFHLVSNFSPTQNLSLSPAALQGESTPIRRRNRFRTKAQRLIAASASLDSCTSGTSSRTFGGQFLQNGASRRRVFFLDVNPLCYEGSRPSLQSFAYWVSLFFDQVSHRDPVIAVLDGERGGELRRQLLPSYKAHRRKFLGQASASQRSSNSSFRSSRQAIADVLRKCNVPVIKIEGEEADDVIATLVEQVLQKDYRVVIASPDKDFKQLISEDVQIVMPLAELDRWSFYTLKHYIAQYQCDPRSDLSLRCIMGDEVDGVPGIQHIVPGFGRKTAIKLLKKHGSLENLLNAATIRTVGRQYAQDALIKYADYLRRNYRVLALRRDIDVKLEEDWLVKRDTSNDSMVFSGLSKLFEEAHRSSYQLGSSYGEHR